MAGIFAHVDDDISKLRQLKNEIKDIKNALSSVNVKIDIDIKAGLEEQLKSLTNQYETLANKVAEVEGRIAQTSARINSATSNIVDSNKNTSATGSVDVKSYNELKSTIESVVGARDGNIVKMIEEQRAIDALKEQIKGLNDITKKGGVLNQEQEQELVSLNSRLLQHKQALSQTMQALRNEVKLEGVAKGSMKELSHSLGQMRMAYRGLSEEARNGDAGKNLLKRIQETDARIKELDASIGNFQRNVGNYPNAMGGMSFMQVATSANAVKTALANMSEEERNSAKGVELQDKLNKLEKKLVELTPSINSVTKGLITLGGIDLAKRLVSQIVEIRGQFQQLEVSFSTMLGDGDKATALLDQLKITAATTPFGMTDIAQGAKGLLAYGLEAEKVNDTLIRLGDIAAGLSIPFGDMVYLFGTTMTQGRLYTQDLNQFLGRGIPLADELAKQFGVTKDKVRELVTAGKVGFPQVEQAIVAMTDKGGKFGGLMEAQSKTITGQISNIQDNLEMMMNDIGKSSEGIINGTLSVASFAIENWESLGRVIMSVVVAYGAYKAALISTIAMEKVAAISRTASIAGTSSFYVATGRLVKAWNAMKVALATNPYTAIATAVLTASYYVYDYVDSLDAVAERNKIVQESTDKLTAKEQESIQTVEDKRKHIEYLIESLNDQTKADTERRRALLELQVIMPSVFSQYKTEKDLIDNITEARKKSNEELSKEINGIKQLSLTEYKKREADFNPMRELLAKGNNLSASEERQKNALRKSLAKAGYWDEDAEWDEISAIMTANQKAYIEARKAVTETIKAEYSTSMQDKTKADLQRELKIAKNRKSQGAILTQEEFSEVYGMSKDENNARIEVLKGMINNFQTATEKEQQLKKAYEDAKEAYDKADKNTLSSSSYDKLKADYKSAKKAYEDYVGTKFSVSTKAAQKAEDEESKATKKNEEDLLKLKQENAKAELDLMEDSSEKKLKAIEVEYNKRAEEINKQEKKFQETNKALNIQGLTSEQQEALNKAREVNKAQQIKDTAEVYKEETTAMRDFLMEYGNFYEQKVAIAEHYEEQIAKATTKGEKMRLEKEKQSALLNAEASDISKQIDWMKLFDNFEVMFRDQIGLMIENLKAITESEDFMKASLDEQKAIYELINALNKTTAKFDGNMFAKVAEDKIAYDNAKSRVDRLKGSSKTNTSDAMKQAEADLVQAGQNLTNSITNAQNAIDSFGSALSNLASGSLSGIGKGLMEIDKLFNNSEITNKVGESLINGFNKLFSNSSVTQSLSSALGNSGLIGSIISAVLSILDVLKDGIGGLISNILDTIFGAINGIVDDILSMEIVTKIGGSLVKGVGHLLESVTQAIGNVLTFGMASGGIGDWFTNSNAAKVASTTERLTARNEVLTQAIDSLTEEMEKARGMESVRTAQEAKALTAEKIENQRQVLEANMGYHNAHRSNNYYIRKALSDEDWATISEVTGERVNNTRDLWQLSPEQLKKLTEIPDIWNKIYNGGKYDQTEYLDDYLALAGALEEIDNSLKETLTGISFDSFYDSFIDTLMDMEASAEDFANDITEYFAKAMLSNKIGELFSKDLEKWYDDFAKFMENDGKLDEQELEYLRKKYDIIVDEAMKERDLIFQATGYDDVLKKQEDSEQEASGGVSSSLTQEQGAKLDGRFTALQLAGEAIKDQNIEQTTQLSLISATMNDFKSIASRIENTMSGITDQISQCYIELQDINDNTAKTATSLKSIASDIAEVKKNTANLN